MTGGFYVSDRAKRLGVRRSAPLWSKSREDPGVVIDGFATARKAARSAALQGASRGRIYAASILCSFLNSGTIKAVTMTTRIVIAPPKITEGTVPRSFAATPDSKAPISFDEPTKI